MQYGPAREAIANEPEATSSSRNEQLPLSAPDLNYDLFPGLFSNLTNLGSGQQTTQLQTPGYFHEPLQAASNTMMYGLAGQGMGMGMGMGMGNVPPETVDPMSMLELPEIPGLVTSGIGQTIIQLQAPADPGEWVSPMSAGFAQSWPTPGENHHHQEPAPAYSQSEQLPCTPTELLPELRGELFLPLDLVLTAIGSGQPPRQDYFDEPLPAASNSTLYGLADQGMGNAPPETVSLMSMLELPGLAGLADSGSEQPIGQLQPPGYFGELQPAMPAGRDETWWAPETTWPMGSAAKPIEQPYGDVVAQSWGHGGPLGSNDAADPDLPNQALRADGSHQEPAPSKIRFMTPTRHLTPAEKKEIRRMVNEGGKGSSIKDVALRLNVSQSTVRAILSQSEELDEFGARKLGPVPDDIRAEILRRSDRGDSRKAIAEDLNVTLRQIDYAKKLQRAAGLHKLGEPPRTIAEMLGLPITTVMRVIGKIADLDAQNAHPTLSVGESHQSKP